MLKFLFPLICQHWFPLSSKNRKPLTPSIICSTFGFFLLEMIRLNASYTSYNTLSVFHKCIYTAIMSGCRIIQTKAKAEGLEELPIIPLHGLRHSCATLLNYLEVNIIEISKTLGHSTCSTTMNIYAHSFEEQQEEVATKVNEFLRLNA